MDLTDSVADGRINNTPAVIGASSSSDKPNQIIKQTTFPMDLAPKIALVKPMDRKNDIAKTQLRQLLLNRTSTTQQVRVAGSTQIITAQVMPPAKQGAVS